MNIINLLSAFGGGIFGAAIGGTSSFILTGFIALAGAAVALSGGSSGIIDQIAFGNLVGTHIMFQGAVAATAYAGRMKAIQHGGDVTQSLHPLEKVSVLLVGGVFGMLGYIMKYTFLDIMHLEIDTVALTVFIMAIVARYTFGKSGLLGVRNKNEKRDWLPSRKLTAYLIVLGGGIGACISGVGLWFSNDPVFQNTASYYAILCFGLSAASLVFIQIGLNTPITHHITLPVANVTILTGNIYIGICVGIACALLGEIFGRTINAKCDTYIDPPATVIVLSSIVFLFL